MNSETNKKNDKTKKKKIYKNYIYSNVRHIAIRTLFILSIPLILVILIGATIPFKEIYNPSSLTYADSAATMYKSNQEYIEITINNAYYTGYDCTRHGKKVGSYYYSLSSNSCTFIVVDTSNFNEIPQVLENYTCKAKLVETDRLIDDVINSFASDIGWTSDGLKSVTSKIMIDETAYNQVLYDYLSTSLAIVFCIIVCFMIVHIIFVILPGLHPACLTFVRLTGKRKYISNVNHELNNKVLLQSGNIILTENYLIGSNAFGLEIIPINKIVWAYKHSSWNKFLGIKFNLTYTLNILCKKKIKSSSPRNKKEDIDVILKYLEQKYPDIILGYSKENKMLAKKKL